MTLTEAPATGTQPAARGRRAGYVISIALNGLMLYVAANLLDWQWFPWLTDDFDRVLPWISFSLGASIAVSAVYLLYDAPWFKSLTQASLSVIAFVVTLRLYRVFPFDFTGYGPPWTGVTEAILIVAMIGTAIGAAVEASKFIVRMAQTPDD